MLCYDSQLIAHVYYTDMCVPIIYPGADYAVAARSALSGNPVVEFDVVKSMTGRAAAFPAFFFYRFHRLHVPASDYII